MPRYKGKIAFVDALTTNPEAAPVLRRYSAQYIPTSIFVDGDGEVAETFVGPLTEAQTRERLDSLL